MVCYIRWTVTVIVPNLRFISNCRFPLITPNGYCSKCMIITMLIVLNWLFLFACQNHTFAVIIFILHFRVISSYSCTIIPRIVTCTCICICICTCTYTCIRIEQTRLFTRARTVRLHLVDKVVASVYTLFLIDPCVHEYCPFTVWSLPCRFEYMFVARWYMLTSRFVPTSMYCLHNREPFVIAPQEARCAVKLQSAWRRRMAYTYAKDLKQVGVSSLRIV